MPAIVSVERVSITVSSGSSSGSANLTKGQTLANCVPLHASSDHGTAAFYANRNAFEFTLAAGPDRVVVTRGTTSSTITFEIDVIEFDPTEVSVQSATFSMASSTATDDVTISAVTIADTCLVASGQTATTETDMSSCLSEYYLSSTTNVKFTRAFTTHDYDGTVFVMEAIAGVWSVEHDVISMTGTSVNVTTPVLTIAKTWHIMSWQAAQSVDDVDDNLITGNQTFTTAFQVRRYSSGGTITGRLQSVEMADATTVQQATISIASGSETDTDTITAVDTAVTSLSPLGYPTIGGGIGRADTSSFGNGDESWAQLTFNSSTEIEGDRGSAAAVDSVSDVEAVEWEMPAGPVSAPGTRVQMAA